MPHGWLCCCAVLCSRHRARNTPTLPRQDGDLQHMIESTIRVLRLSLLDQMAVRRGYRPGFGKSRCFRWRWGSIGAECQCSISVFYDSGTSKLAISPSPDGRALPRNGHEASKGPPEYPLNLSLSTRNIQRLSEHHAHHTQYNLQFHRL
jgi:hypothetical protein